MGDEDDSRSMFSNFSRYSNEFFKKNIKEKLNEEMGNEKGEIVFKEDDEYFGGE